MKKIYYFLTPQGGDMWESVFQPQWHLYVIRNRGVDAVGRTVSEIA
jgi:hypothetical protein